MTATYIQDGDIIDHIPTTDLPNGAVVVLGAIVGIAHRSIPAGALGSLAIEGIWDLPSAGGAAAAWAPAYWNLATSQVTADGGVAGVVRCGVFVRPVAATDPTVRVLLNR